MPNLSPITVLDRKPTPDSHLFEPGPSDAGVALFTEYGDVKAGENTLSISTRDTGKKTRVRLVLKMPQIDTTSVDGLSFNVVTRVAYANLELTFENTSTEQERKDTVGVLANLLAASQTAVNAVLTQNKGFY